MYIFLFANNYYFFQRSDFVSEPNSNVQNLTTVSCWRFSGKKILKLLGWNPLGVKNKERQIWGKKSSTDLKMNW